MSKRREKTHKVTSRIFNVRDEEDALNLLKNADSVILVSNVNKPRDVTLLFDGGYPVKVIIRDNGVIQLISDAGVEEFQSPEKAELILNTAEKFSKAMRILKP